MVVDVYDKYTFSPNTINPWNFRETLCEKRTEIQNDIIYKGYDDSGHTGVCVTVENSYPYSEDFCSDTTFNDLNISIKSGSINEDISCPDCLPCESCSGILPPTIGSNTLNAASSYTFVLNCQGQMNAKLLTIYLPNVIVIAKSEPTGNEFLINGLPPSSISQWSLDYNSFWKEYTWKGLLYWEMTINGKCGDKITLTPLLTTGFGIGSISSIIVKSNFSCEDKDGDGHYAISADCPQGDDCDDNDPEVYPGAPEICDCKDNNCNGIIDEGCKCEVNMRASPSEVWPVIPSSQAPPGYSDDLTVSEISVSLRKPAPPEGCNINLKVEPVEYSGGHLHDGNRKKGTISRDTFTFSGCTIGAASATYKSVEVSGDEKIIAEVDGEKVGETTIQVKVPGLTELAGGYYNLKCDIQSCSGYNHKDFYNVQLWVKSLFDIIAEKYHEKFPQVELLVATDASLTYGGLYDYKNTWASPHNTHRIGTDIDVRSKNIAAGQRRKDFERFVCDNYGLPKLEFSGSDNEHYHLYFFPYRNLGKLCEGEILL
jgi:hypothetical protein